MSYIFELTHIKIFTKFTFLVFNLVPPISSNIFYMCGVYLKSSLEVRLLLADI